MLRSVYILDVEHISFRIRHTWASPIQYGLQPEYRRFDRAHRRMKA